MERNIDLPSFVVERPERQEIPRGLIIVGLAFAAWLVIIGLAVGLYLLLT